jgi:hypothetical protein
VPSLLRAVRREVRARKLSVGCTRSSLFAVESLIRLLAVRVVEVPSPCAIASAAADSAIKLSSSPTLQLVVVAKSEYHSSFS